jgi:peptidoglycan/LPS O-acetylase OafA/YrhL
MARRTIQASAYRSLAEGLACFAVVTLGVCGWVAASHRFVVPDMAILGYTPLLLFCISGDFNVTPTIQRWIEAAGNLTYSSYLLHFPIQIMIGFVAFIAVTFLAARLTYLYFEAPAQTMIRARLLPGSRAKVATLSFAAEAPMLPRKAD